MLQSQKIEKPTPKNQQKKKFQKKDAATASKILQQQEVEKVRKKITNTKRN